MSTVPPPPPPLLLLLPLLPQALIATAAAAMKQLAIAFLNIDPPRPRTNFLGHLCRPAGEHIAAARAAPSAGPASIQIVIMAAWALTSFRSAGRASPATARC